MIAVLKHELSLYYHGITAYIFGAFLLVFTGLGALIYNINASVANFEYVLGFISLVFIVVVPLLTMRIIAEERKQKTDQLLYSLPISTTSVVIGKFIAMAIVYAVPMIIIAFYPLIFSKFGDVYLPTSYGSLFAFFLLGLALMSIGMFISSLTESQGLSAGICVAVMLLNYFSTTLADYVSSTALSSFISLMVLAVLIALLLKLLTKSDYVAIGFGAAGIIASVVCYIVNPDMLEGLLPDIMNKLSLFERFDVFVNGIFDLTAVVYFISVMAFFLFLSVQSLEKRRYN